MLEDLVIVVAGIESTFFQQSAPILMYCSLNSLGPGGTSKEDEMKSGIRLVGVYVASLLTNVEKGLNIVKYALVSYSAFTIALNIPSSVKFTASMYCKT